MYSRYDHIKQQHHETRRLQVALRIITAVPVTLLVAISANTLSNGIVKVLLLVSAFVAGYILSHVLYSQLSIKYRNQRECINNLAAEMRLLRTKMSDEIERVERRQKGQQFKKAYDLSGRKIDELEKLLGLAMWHEKKEVWVTAFCRKGVVVRVTAAIGSAYSCRPADDVSKWVYHAKKMRCDEIRQYHNHPTYDNHTAPSWQDIQTSSLLRAYLADRGNILKSFIIFWNDIYEFRVLVYSDGNEHSIEKFYDVSVSSLQLANGA